MNGKETVRRAMTYKADAARLRLRSALASDAASRVTRPMSAQGGGGASADRLGETVSLKADVDTALRARRTCYLLELEEAARLIAMLDPPECGEIMRRTCLLGETMRQTAAAMHRSEDSVRGYRRRGWRALEAMHSDLDKERKYRRARTAYERALAAADAEDEGVTP